MKRPFHRGLMALVAALALGAVGAGVAAPAMAQEPGAAVNGVMVCPPDLGNGEIDPNECIEPAAGVEVYMANPNTDNVEFGTTGGDGLVSFPLDRFALSPEGALVEIGILVESNPYGPLTGHVVGCSRNGEPLDTGTINTVVNPGGTALAVQLTVFEGDQVSCEWFLSHHTSDVGEEDGATPADRLPATGTGIADGTAGHRSAQVLGAVLGSTITGGAALAVRRTVTRLG